MLTRTTYIGRHRFNTKFWKTRERKPETEVVEMMVLPIIEVAEFEAESSKMVHAALLLLMLEAVITTDLVSPSA